MPIFGDLSQIEKHSEIKPPLVDFFFNTSIYKLYRELIYILDIPDDIDDQKEDEKLAIQSIYGDSALVEKIPGKLWELKLENLSLIETMLPSTMKKPPRNPNVVTREMLEKDPSVCQWYLRPKGCKFGKKCFKKHVNPDKDHVGVDDKHLKDLDADEKVVILEIRCVEENNEH